MASAQRRQQRRDHWYKRRSRYREERKYRYQNSDRLRQRRSAGEPEEGLREEPPPGCACARTSAESEPSSDPH
jgi:hypothetical protein